MMQHTVDFQPLGRRGQCREDESLANCARRLGIGINNVCGGLGTCLTCRVRIVAGSLSAPAASEEGSFPPEELEAGWRLACQAFPRSDCTVSVPAESLTAPQRTQVDGLEVEVEPEPRVSGHRARMEPPMLTDLRADGDRLLDALAASHQLHCRRIDLGVLRELSPQLRTLGWQCRAVVRDDEVIGVGPWPGRLLGLAVDVGTTKIAGYLVDLDSGRTLAARGVMNPQIECGEDVVTRISYAVGHENGSRRLQSLAINEISALAADLCAEVGANAKEVADVVLVGNTALHHFLLGLPVAQLVAAPFTPAVSRAVDIKARDIGLRIAPGGYVHFLPNIAGFVGGDHVAALLATREWQVPGPAIVLDIGTNTEVSVVRDGRIQSVSCASGPAFEGGHIKDGMRAAPGAIERVRIAGSGTAAGGVQYQTVDGAPPAGICGSGVLDAIAELHRAGILDEGGRLSGDHTLVRGDGRQREFVLAEDGAQGRPPVTITQRDIRELQLAKAAIRTGIQALLESVGCAEEDIRQVVIAGAFGSYIDVASAIEAGMLPSLPEERFRQVGNAAGLGARMALVSRALRAEAANVASRVTYLELAGTPNFMKTFVETSHLGRYRLRNSRREAIQ